MVSTPEPRQALRLIVLDYDDTLCPSSWIASQPDRVASENDTAILQHVEESISALFRQADALGCRVARAPRPLSRVARADPALDTPPREKPFCSSPLRIFLLR